MNVRTGNGAKYKKVGSIKKGTVITVNAKRGNWYRFKYKGSNRYVNSKYLKRASSKNNKSVEFVNVKSVDSSIIVDLRYNTTNNFTGKRIYDFNQAILRKETAERLAKANSILKKQGYVLKIWDAYRPLFAQEILWNTYPDPRYVAKPNPNNIRGHQLGNTVDVTLSTIKGTEIKMQSGFDDFSSKAWRDYKRTKTEDKYYKILDKAMIEAGFTGYQYEWWDYRDNNKNYKPIQVDPSLY